MLDKFGAEVHVGDIVAVADDWTSELRKGVIVVITKPKKHFYNGEALFLTECKVETESNLDDGIWESWKFSNQIILLERKSEKRYIKYASLKKLESEAYMKQIHDDAVTSSIQHKLTTKIHQAEEEKQELNNSYFQQICKEIISEEMKQKFYELGLLEKFRFGKLASIEYDSVFCDCTEANRPDLVRVYKPTLKFRMLFGYQRRNGQMLHPVYGWWADPNITEEEFNAVKDDLSNDGLWREYINYEFL